MFQCSQSSRGWWNKKRLPSWLPNYRVSVLSVEPWLVELCQCDPIPLPVVVSVLSVEPWLVELHHPSSWCVSPPVSVLSVEPWLVEPGSHPTPDDASGCFSALSRAVVGGTFRRGGYGAGCGGFSALSRAVVGGTKCQRRIIVHPLWFQCSQSSRGWWNFTAIL